MASGSFNVPRNPPGRRPLATGPPFASRLRPASTYRCPLDADSARTSTPGIGPHFSLPALRSRLAHRDAPSCPASSGLRRPAGGNARVVDPRRHRALLENLRVRNERIADAAFLPGALRMMTAFTDVFSDDPVLPPELLPRPWPGRAARDLLVRSRRLALRLRSAQDRPALFRAFDELIASMP